MMCSQLAARSQVCVASSTTVIWYVLFCDGGFGGDHTITGGMKGFGRAQDTQRGVRHANT